jgi:hypothetical protein
MPVKTKPIVTNPVLSDDRRSEPRHLICFGRPIHISWLRQQSLLGALIEVSRSGFRMLHQFRHFEVGQEVKVAFPWGEVKARVAWSRVGKKHVQTGFSLLDAHGHHMPCPE